MWITGKTRLQKKKQERTYPTGGSNHVSSPQHSHRPQLCWQGYKVRCPKCCRMACICPMTCASNLTLQGQSQLRQLNFPHPGGAAPYISSLPTQRGYSFPPPPKHWWNRVSHLLAPSLSLTRLLHCFLPTTAPPPAALKPPPTPLTPFKPVVCSSYPNTGELNLLVTQHTCSRTSCAQSTEKSLT